MSPGPDHWGKHLRRRAATLAATAAVVAGPAVGVAEAGTVPSGFQETSAITGLSNPAAFTFAPDGRVFIGEKSGLIKVFDGLSDTTPETFADLRTETYNFWDRGLLGLTIDPQFSSGRPYLYALYTLDKTPSGSVPSWGTPGVSGDPCPNPPGATGDGCLASGRLARLTVGAGSTMSAKTDLITDWCQQYPSHSIGDVAVGPNGALYVSAGDGASFNFVDWGQDGSPVNPCGDPPGDVGGAMTPPSAEGGALRSQDPRTTSDPTGLDGALLRVDPNTGAAWPGNPFAASSDANQRRIAAFGFRNPFRLTVRPGTNEVWLGDVGWNNWEEINRVADPGGAVAENLGWPCYEGSGANGSYDGTNLSLCESLYSQGAGAIVAPHYAYSHASKVVTGETCPSGSSSISGLRFYESGDFPNAYNGALFFSDYSRDCIWAMYPGGGGLPSPASIQTFDAGASNPVDLEIHQGELFYANLDGGTIQRVRYTTGNQAPNADAVATPSSGPAPLDVELDASASSDPDDAFGDLDFAWDADNDGQFDDGSQVTLDRTYGAGSHVARVRVTDPDGETDTDSVTIVADAPDEAPVAQITAPTTSTNWAVGDEVSFSGTATDDEALTASAYDWELVINHCPSNCHQHVAEEFTDRTSGSFFAPDHEYPSSLTLRLTVTDTDGLSDAAEVEIDPHTVDVTVASTPIGLQVGLNAATGASPLTRTVIEGSQNTAIAPSTQTLGSAGYAFASWSDGGAATHNFVAAEDMTLVATFVADANPADTTPPDTVITGRPAARTHVKKRGHSNRAAFTFSATEPVSGFACSLDGASFTACLTPRSYTALKRGSHRFRVRAKDLAGNVDPTPASYSFLCVIKKKKKKKP